MYLLFTGSLSDSATAALHAMDEYQGTLNNLSETVENVLSTLMESEIKKQKFEDDVLSILVKINQNFLVN